MRQKWLSERRRMNRKLRTLLRLDTREICPEAKLRVLTWNLSHIRRTVTRQGIISLDVALRLCLLLALSAARLVVALHVQRSVFPVERPVEAAGVASSFSLVTSRVLIHRIIFLILVLVPQLIFAFKFAPQSCMRCFAVGAAFRLSFSELVARRRVVGRLPGVHASRAALFTDWHVLICIIREHLGSSDSFSARRTFLVCIESNHGSRLIGIILK